MSNVKLAIRVRPFTDRELRSEKDRIPVVSVVDAHTVTITNVKVSTSGAGDSRERVRRYNADYTFDSACAPKEPSYASQEKIFESIGREVVACVKGGSSACVLAYGQSATGKTHTMMGTFEQPGLVPRLCRAFAEPALDVTVSFLEIYNERVHDLLAGEPLQCHSLPRRRGNARKDLRVREHPERGPYVQNLRRVAVTDLETLLSLVEEGARRRQTAATRRNSTSSRSHALLELATPRATLHLADLAGSEKASWEGCGGGRQKEGANINKSLVALSNVISALVSGGSRGRFVPYRDSALTWLLKDCFTGGASAFIIATVSPSVACYGESASTLRWAERARQLRTPRVHMNGPSAASRAVLQSQLNQLLEELAKHHIIYNLQTGKIAYDENHWTLKINTHNVDLKEALKTESKIGNILNNMFKPKTDTQTSESTASSVASGSSDVINTIDKNVNIRDEICQEVDKFLTPALERTRSNSDIEVVAPLRRRRQYKSQEVLPIDKTLRVFDENSPAPSARESQERLNVLQEPEKVKPAHVPILYDNQRAEIVASVTERLYSKLKKKEEAAVSKVESMVDKKIMEPLSELRICTNARQRLMDISQRAMRNKRRIGIPAHTQTRMTVTRVRDQGIDVQTDLEAYILRKDRSFTLQKDAATETMPMTPRCKDIAVGPVGSLDFRDRATATETKEVIQRNSFMMTDVVTKYDRCSQTVVLPPPRRKRRVNTRCSPNNGYRKPCSHECSVSPVININITQPYQIDSETQSSDENVERQSSDENLGERVAYIKPTVVSSTPDLLTNHNSVDTSTHEDSKSENILTTNSVTDVVKEGIVHESVVNNISCEENCLLFSEESSEEPLLPRVTAASAKIAKQDDMKDLILGRNDSMYPYNIILSPPREREDSKRMVKFKDIDVAPAMSVASQTSWEWSQEKIKSDLSSVTSAVDNESKINETNNSQNNANCVLSETTDSSKDETNSFVWKNCTKTCNLNKLNKDYSPVYKNNLKYRTARTKIYKEFLGLNNNKDKDLNQYPQLSSHIDVDDVSSSDSLENENSQNNFRQRRQFFEDKFNHLRNLNFDRLENNVLDSCRSLDATVNKYENYLGDYQVNKCLKSRPRTTPSEYLQHLVQLRREVVRTGCESTDSSVSLSRI